MTMPAFQTRNTAQKKHDRSFTARPFGHPLRPPRSEQGDEQPAWLKSRARAEDYPAEPNWLITGEHWPALNGLDQTWWRMLPGAAASLLATWRERARVRRELARIDARSLREAGIDPGAADFEAAQPFWRKPTTLRDLPTDR